MKKTKAFTLIELLVVVAIIALLAALILTALAYYRDEAKDTRIKTALSQVRQASTLIFNASSDYSSVCSSDSKSLGSNHDLTTIQADVEKFGGAISFCSSTPSAFCVQSSTNRNGTFCVDSTGVATKGESCLGTVCH